MSSLDFIDIFVIASIHAVGVLKKSKEALMLLLKSEKITKVPTSILCFLHSMILASLSGYHLLHMHRSLMDHQL